MADEVPLWNQRDKCLSPYSGDHELYKGVIMNIRRLPEGQQIAVVKFDGYAHDYNEEVNIDKLVKVNDSEKVKGNTYSGERVEGGTSHDSHFKTPLIPETGISVTHADFYGANQGSSVGNQSNQAYADNNHGNQDDCQSNKVNQNGGQGNQCGNQGNSRECKRDRSNSRERPRDNSYNRNCERNATESSSERNRSRDRCSDSGEQRRSQDRDRSGSRERRGNQSQNPWQGNQPLNQSPQNDRSMGNITSPQRDYGQNRCYDSPNSYSFQGSQYSRGPYPNFPNQGGRQGGWYGSDFSSDGGRHRRDEDSDVFLSKTLSSILRHNAKNFGLELMNGGFLYVDEILQQVRKLQCYKIADIRRIVDSNDKKRFSLETENNRLKIRANQGHSIQVEGLALTPITSAKDVPIVFHGTYLAAWELIKATGLHRMNRNHIHFAAGEPGKSGVISGMRASCEVMIHINMEKALKDGLKFYRSANNVILCDGDKDGVIYPCYFATVLHRFHRSMLPYDNTICSASANNKAAAGETDSKKKRKKKSKKDKEEKAPENLDDELMDASTKEHDDGATTDESSLPAAKKHHMQQPTDDAKPATDSSVNDSISASQTEDSVVEAYEGWNDEPTFIKDLDQSKSFVDYLINKPPSHIAVCCIGENLGQAESQIHVIVISAHPETYVYNLHDNKDLVMNGDLCQILMHKSISKVFNDIGAASISLINEYDILMDGTPIWDIEMTYNKVTLPDMQLEALKENYGFTKSTVRKWAGQNEEFGKKVMSNDLDQTVVMELMERGKLMWELFAYCERQFNDVIIRALKKEIYPAAMTSSDKFLANKIDQLKLERKGKGKKKQVDVEGSSQQQSQQQQHKKGEGAQQQQKNGKSGKGKSGKGKKR